MPVVRRSKWDLIAVTLEIASKEPVTQTAIIYNSFQNYKTGSKLLKGLVSKGYIEAVGKKYQTTLKGQAWLQRYTWCKQIDFNYGD